MAYDPVLGSPTPDSANEGRGKWNSMTGELDSRLAVVEGNAPDHKIYELQTDVTSRTSAFTDTGLAFPVLGGVLYNFEAMFLWSPEFFDPLWAGSAPNPASGGAGRAALFGVSGPGSTPDPVDWLHYQLIFWGGLDAFSWGMLAYSQYNAGAEQLFYGVYYGGETFFGGNNFQAGSVGDRVSLMQGFVKPPSSGTFKLRFCVYDGDDFDPDLPPNGSIVRAGSSVEVW